MSARPRDKKPRGFRLRAFSRALVKFGGVMSTQIPQRKSGTCAGETTSGAPWIRLPKPGAHEENTGLGRAVLSRLAASGKVKSISLREPGARRGCRLISLPSLLRYLDGLAAGQEVGQ